MSSAVLSGIPSISVTIGPNGLLSTVEAVLGFAIPVDGVELPDAPINSVLPDISGIEQDGQTLTGSNGIWSGSPTFACQWKRDGVAILLATASTYALVTADVGTVITFTITATNAGGSTDATSVATGMIVEASEDLPAPPEGYDVIGVFGDSNANGMVISYPGANPDDTLYERGAGMTDHANVYQFPGPDATTSGVTPNVITAASAPLYGNSTSTIEDRVSIGEFIAKYWYENSPAMLANPARRVLVVNMGRGGANVMTAATNDVSPGGIGVGGTYYEAAITQFQNAYAAAKAEYEGSRFIGFLYCGPSNDANRVAAPLIDQAAMTAALADVVEDARTRVPNSEAWFGFMNILPSMAAASAAACRNAVNAAATAADKAFAVAPANMTSDDGLHPRPPSLELAGEALSLLAAAELEPQIVEDFSIPPINGAPLDTPMQSEPVMVMVGYGEAVPISCTHPFSINGGGFSASTRMGYWGDLVIVERNSSDMIGTPTTATLTIDTKSADFNVTTLSPKIRIATRGNIVLAGGVFRIASGDILLEAA